MVRYEHTQLAGWPIFASFLAVIIATLYAGLFVPFWPVLLMTGLFVLLVIMFYGLTVQIDEERLLVRFGRGPIRVRFKLDEMTDCRIVRNKWYYGWGIHLTPHGWLYNISGMEAVEIDFRDGHQCRVGTDDPQGLESSLRAAIRRRA